MNLLKKDAEFCGENMIVRKLNVCFIKQLSVGAHFFECINDGILGESINV